MQAEEGVKSWYRLRITEIDRNVMQQIIAWMGRDDAKKTLAADSTGFGVSGRRRWINAKYGELDTKMFDKMHIIQAINGKICAIEITDGSANDSPVLREMLTCLPCARAATCWQTRHVPTYETARPWQILEETR